MIVILVVVATSYLTINKSHSYGMGQILCTHNGDVYGAEIRGHCPPITKALGHHPVTGLRTLSHSPDCILGTTQPLQ